MLAEALGCAVALALRCVVALALVAALGCARKGSLGRRAMEINASPRGFGGWMGGEVGIPGRQP